VSDEIKPRFDPESEFEKQKKIVEDKLRKVSDFFLKHYNQEAMTDVIDRLGNAGWLEGINLVKKDLTCIRLSPKGKVKMLEFINLYKTIKINNVLNLDGLFSFCKSEFNPPLTVQESTALAALLLEYFMKFELPKLLKLGDTPPPA